MKRRILVQLLPISLAAVLGTGGAFAQATDEAPDAMIKRLSNEVLEIIKADKALQSGNVARIVEVVDSKIMPSVNFRRMTASATGPAWRKATPEQQARLQAEFKTLLVRTYAGALTHVNDKQIVMKPMRARPQDTEVVVRSEVRGSGEPIQLEYRMEKTPGQGFGWKVYDLNVMGVWLVDTYRSQFAQEINAKGLDGLIASLSERNKANANGRKS